jgi:hypothetical protein
MSVTDQIKNLFVRKPQELEKDSALSLAMPDQDAELEPGPGRRPCPGPRGIRT